MAQLAWSLRSAQTSTKGTSILTWRAVRASSNFEDTNGVINDSKAKTHSGVKNTRECDVVIVGAGIIGVTIAHHILQNSSLSITIIDAARPCAATGAGQGYVWMSHRAPKTPGWALANRSKHLWEELAVELQASNIDPKKALGYRRTGSLLIAPTASEAETLKDCVMASSMVGVPAVFLSAAEARRIEPSLSADYLTAAALFPEDFQIGAKLAMELLLQRVRAFSSSGRYTEIFKTSVKQFICSPTNGCIIGVEIPGERVYCSRAVVLATGAWSSTMMAKATAGWGLSIIPPVKPRKGHLLVINGVSRTQVKHGIMECEYLTSAKPLHGHDIGKLQGDPLQLAMTATMDQYGNLLLGSSREFIGFNTDVHSHVVESILNRARKFLGNLSDISIDSVLQNGIVQTGLRPFIQDGRPLIGAAQGVSGLIYATGHEGSGLCLSLGTAEMVANMIEGKECVVDPLYFSPTDRLQPSLVR